MGEAVNLVDNFKVEKVILNCGDFNDLENNLIKVLKRKNIDYNLCLDKLEIDNYKFKFLNTKKYNNENDNSIVIFADISNNKLLLMGDAGVEVEKNILNKYNLKDIDILKIGHHGSNTSNSEIFIKTIKPKNSIISVGKKNKFGHPKDSVINMLKDSKVYRTDLDGSIEIKIEKNQYMIKTCRP